MYELNIIYEWDTMNIKNSMLVLVLLSLNLCAVDDGNQVITRQNRPKPAICQVMYSQEHSGFIACFKDSQGAVLGELSPLSQNMSAYDFGQELMTRFDLDLLLENGADSNTIYNQIVFMNNARNAVVPGSDTGWCALI